MSAARLMQPLSGKTDGEAPRINAATKVAVFAAEIVAARKCFIVIDADNRPIGEITPEAVIGLLAGSEHAGAPR
jgi:glycine betaine/proline transport system ATP-binding protein